MASYQDGSSLEFSPGHKREQSQDSGAYIDWNSEDSASPVGNPDANGNEDFVTVVAVEDGGKNEPTSFVTILAIGEADDIEEEVLVYRLPGERLGFGLKFEGGTNTAENVKRLFIQSSAPDSPASRAKCSWGFLVEGDEILKIDGHVVKDMTRLDCVRCLKESSVVIKLFVRHKNEKAKGTEIRVNNGSSPTVVSAEMKKTIPPPPPVPPRKIARKSPTKEEGTVTPPESFCDTQNNPIPKARNIQPVTDVNSSKFVIKVPHKGNHESPDLAKRIVKRTGSNLKLVPPEPKVYLDILAMEDSRNCESESDDTGSTISTVVGMSFPNTTNSSFCDSTSPSTTPTSEPTTPVLDLSKLYERTNNEFLFTKLIDGKDHDDVSHEEKITNDEIAPLQPPLSFQDAPLSYGNEEMRANLTETFEFQTEVIKTQPEVLIDPEYDGKLKDSLKSTASKKPSLIPRLAKTIGLLSPPKPSPRKEAAADKSRSKKKTPAPTPTSDNILNGDPETKTLKPSIPYLKKKKTKSDDSKKKKLKSPTGDENREKLNSLLKNVTEDVKKECQAPGTPESDPKLSWEVPSWKNSKEAADLSNLTKEMDEPVADAETKPFLPELENGGDAIGGSEANFLFQWGGSKQLETIGEDEEDSSVDGVPDRSTNDKETNKNDPPTKILKDTQANNEGYVLVDQNQTEDTGNEKEEQAEEEKENSNLEVKDANSLDDFAGKKDVMVYSCPHDEFETNGPKQSSGLCSNHVLVKLDHDSSDIVEDVDLNAPNDEMKQVMVSVVSTTSTPNCNRMPPDGHEFPQSFREESKNQDDDVVPPLPATEPPSKQSAKGSLFFDGPLSTDAKFERTKRDPAKAARNSFWRQDEKSEKSVRDKIAMFSSVPDSEKSGKLSKFKSSEDVLCYDETDCRNFRNGKLFSQSILSLEKVSPFKKPCGGSSGHRSLDFINRTQSSIDLSSSSAYSSSCSPDSSLSSNSSYLGYSSTLPRKKTSKADKKETGVHRTTSFNVHGRSQSLLNVGPVYKTRHSSESSQDDGTKPCSLNLLIEQRRKNLSKLRGLVIPEKLSDVMPSQPIVDLPEIKSRDLILSAKVFKTCTDTPKNKWVVPETNVAPRVTPSHLWDQTAMPNIPKYSPAFKRKSISVFGSKEYSAKAPVKPPRNLLRLEDRKYQDVNSSDGETFLSEKGQKCGDSPRSNGFGPKHKSTPLGKYRLHGETGRSEEDSDNDSAVSSSRSSISHGFSPPASPLPDGQFQVVDDSNHKSAVPSSSPDRTPFARTLSRELTVSALSNASTPAFAGSLAVIVDKDANNKRVLKPQSVEAINRKNVLASAKYSRGFDTKTGSPLIRRKFSENAEETYHPERKRAETGKVAYITEVVENKKTLEKSESLPAKPSSPQPVASRKMSAPFAFSWGPYQDEPKNETRYSSKDEPEKDSEFSCSRIMSGKSDPESSVSQIPSDSIQKSVKHDPKVASNCDKIPGCGPRSASVNDIRKAFEKIEAGIPPTLGRMANKTGYCGVNGNHVRVSSLDSTNSEDNSALVQGHLGFSNLQREQFGSITSLASSTSLISPQELQLLIEEANQTLEESGSNAGGTSPNNHDVLVIILHRDSVGGSVGITLAGGADYESKEITVHKVLAGSPADRDGRIQKGDRILSINGKSMKGVTHRESLAILKSPRLEVVLVVSRLKSDAHHEGINPDDGAVTALRHGFLSSSSRPPRILERKSVNESGGPREAELTEVARGSPVSLKLVKDGAGLGFSLEGGKDCPTGDRPLVIKKIFTGGAAEKCGELKAGDEIVNVNGIDVSVMSRIEVWKLMKQLPDGSVSITVRHQA